ncbi:RNA-directed DNA polymerase, eukaryota, reverse transcriptase zinc-binding domain protein [Tanacetum coccineum]
MDGNLQAPATVTRPAATSTSDVGKSVETNSPKITSTSTSNTENNIVSIKNSFEALMERVMHTCVYFKADKKELFCSFIYVHNRYTLHRALWRNLNVHTHYVRGRPWCLLGDFNAALHLEDKSVGDDGILKKIDRIMSKLEFHDAYMGARAMFQPYRISDHSSAVIKLRIIATSKLCPFKYSNILVHNTQFKNLVREGWNEPVSGFIMFKVVKKLLCKLLYDQGNIHAVGNTKSVGHFQSCNSLSS